MSFAADPFLFVFVPFLTLLVAALIKGAIGIGLPAASLSILALFMGPREAITMILVPMVVSNAWQVYRSGHVTRTFLRYLPFAFALGASVCITVILTQDTSDRSLLAILGISILVFVAISVTPYSPRIGKRAAPIAQAILGTAGGVMGGLTSIWAPAIVMYLAARRIAKEEFVRAGGMLIFLGALPLAIMYAVQGFVSIGDLAFSTLLLIPTYIGFTLGERIRYALNENVFRLILLGLFFLMGLNLIRQAYV